MVGRPFEPGKSGNPGGRPKENNRIKELARQHTDAALNALVAALDNPKERVAAAVAILDRGYGKPAQTHSGDEDNPLVVRLEKIARVIVDPRNPNS